MLSFAMGKNVEKEKINPLAGQAACLLLDEKVAAAGGRMW